MAVPPADGQGFPCTHHAVIVLIEPDHIIGADHARSTVTVTLAWHPLCPRRTFLAAASHRAEGSSCGGKARHLDFCHAVQGGSIIEVNLSCAISPFRCRHRTHHGCWRSWRSCWTCRLAMQGAPSRVAVSPSSVIVTITVRVDPIDSVHCHARCCDITSVGKLLSGPSVTLMDAPIAVTAARAAIVHESNRCRT